MGREFFHDSNKRIYYITCSATLRDNCRVGSPVSQPGSQPTTTTTSSTAGVIPVQFPKATYKPGKPGPTLKSRCGTPCFIFCDTPCLLNCRDGGNDFIDPEFSLPAPTYANPKPPVSNCATESRHCYNNGASTDRGSMIDGVNAFCNYFSGRIPDASSGNMEHTLRYILTNIEVMGGTAAACVFSFGISGCWEYLTIQVTTTSGCRFTVDGPDVTDGCGRIFREVIYQCDASSTQYKQGGTVTSNCAVWRIDPNVDD
ncbi:hypothetical protein GQX73_g5940 [Xylaria multiplex]|uniref:Uncharacterized protein n=1 Tax=Xylaria multiplex TaxID=323545 RepID=A0A7C8IMP5_9PEZI|nr:hypothetical protein GQX73_g5940 [Xylaria multiplex]